MIVIDLVQTPTVPALIHQLCRFFNIHVPSAATIYRDKDRQMVLALEPDSQVHDLEALQKDDQLVLCPRRHLKEESLFMRAIGWSKTYDLAIDKQYHLQETSTNANTNNSHEEVCLDNDDAKQQPLQD